MDKIINNYENVDLGGSDIMRMCKNKVRIIEYEDLKNYTYIDQIFNEWNATIILYETKKDFGHWVVLLKHNNNELEFFDSYGLMVDEELKYDNAYNSRLNNGAIVPYLTDLLSKSTYKLIVNRKRLQLFLENINTCGRWCVARVILRNIELQQFIKLFTQNVNHTPDFWVTAYTMLL